MEDFQVPKSIFIPVQRLLAVDARGVVQIEEPVGSESSTGVWGTLGEDFGGGLRRLCLSEWCGDASPAPLPHSLEPVATWRTQDSILITD